MNTPAEPGGRVRSFMGMARPHTLATRLVALGTVIVIISLLALGASWFALSRQTLQVEVQRRHQELARRVAVQVSTRLGESPTVYYTQIWSVLRAVDLEEGGVIYLVDDAGRLLGYAGFEGLQGQDMSRQPFVAAFLRRQPVTGELPGVTGESVVGAWAALDHGWGVIVETPTRRALAGLEQLALIFYASLFGSVLLATVAMDLFARRLVRPLVQLQEGAIAIGQGELDRTIEVSTGDEIEDLARQFNQMAQSLQASQAEIRSYAQELEQRVVARTSDLERRAIQLTTAAEVGRAAASILDLETLMHRVVELVRERFNLYYVGLFLLDDAGEYAVLAAGTGEAGRLMEARGHKLACGGASMVGAACAQRQARIALDVGLPAQQPGMGAEAIRFDNPLLPATRSELALPLIVGDRVLGALDVQSAQPAAFSSEDLTVLQLVADQVAVAVENARKFSAEAALLEAASPIYRISRRLATATTTEEVADAIISSVAETGVDGCVVVGFEFAPTGEPTALLYLGVWRRDRTPQFRRGQRLPFTESPFPLEVIRTLWTAADVETDERLPQSARQVFLSTGVRALANVPLRAGERIIGQVVVLRAAAGPFAANAVRIYEALSDQAAVALERARLLDEARRRAESERLLGEITSRVRASLDPDAILQTTVRELGRALGAERVTVEITGAAGLPVAESARVGEDSWA